MAIEGRVRTYKHIWYNKWVYANYVATFYRHLFHVCSMPDICLFATGPCQHCDSRLTRV